MESRLKRRSLKQSKKQLYGSLLAIAILLFLTLNFGPYLISGLGRIIDTIAGKSGQKIIIKSQALEPPILEALPSATPSAFIDVTGRSFYQDGTVELFVNGEKYNSQTLDGDFDFEIKDVRLNAGENTLNVRMIRDSIKSEFSQDYKVIYIKDEPKLEIDFPEDKASFSAADQEITIRGKTDPGNNVRINNFIAIVDSEGNFSYTYKLSEGENKLIITAENLAGRTIEKEITVSYSP